VSSEDVLDRPGAGRTALRGGTIRTAGYVIGTLLTLASAPLLVRQLGFVEFGQYVTVTSLVTLVGGFSELGLNQLALREYAAGDPAARRRVFPLLVGLRLLVSAAGVLVAIAFAVLAGYENALVVGTAGAGAGLLIGGLQSLWATPLQGDLRYGALTAVELLRQALSVAAIVALVLAGAGVLAFLLIQIPVGAIALALTLWLVRSRVPPRVSFDTSGAWDLVRDTLAYAVAAALNVAYFRVAMIVTSLLASERETGYFATSFRVVEVLVAFPSLLVGAAFPILARSADRDEARFDQAIRRILQLSLLAGAALSLVVALGAPVIVEVLTGEQPEPAVTALRIQAAALTPTFLAFAGGYALLSLRAYRGILLREVGAIAIAIAASLALVGPLGAEGAAISALAAELGLALGSLLLLARLRPGSVALGRALTATALAVAGGAATLLLGLPALPTTVLGMLVFTALLAVTGQLPRELAAVLPRFGSR
jgi:O-antigen/teichoic acid export membrane protein